MRRYLIYAFILVSSGFFLSGLGSAGEVAVVVPELVTDGFTASLQVEAGIQPVGAFEISVYYNPKVISVNQVLGGKTKEFSRAPITNIDNKEGTVFLTSFQADSLESPTGSVNIANIDFKVLGSSGDKSLISVEVKRLLDTNGVKIASKPVSANVTVK